MGVIYGIGVDCVEVARIRRSMEKPRFAQWVFSEEERQMLDALGDEKRVESAAANFAAKEALLKAAGVGLGGFALNEMSALRKDNGMPYYLLKGTAKDYLEKNNLTVHLSLGHDNGFAIAFAILEKA